MTKTDYEYLNKWLNKQKLMPQSDAGSIYTRLARVESVLEILCKEAVEEYNRQQARKDVVP